MADTSHTPEHHDARDGGERTNRATSVYRRYTRWSRLSRFALLAFVIFSGVALIWLVPWFPSGLESQDYTPQFAFTVYLLGGMALIGMCALGLRELARRDRETLMVLGTVYDEETGLHNRTYLYDRLALEATRAERLNYVFSLLVFQIRLGRPGRKAPALPKGAVQTIANCVSKLTHATDLVALLSDSELAVLAIGVDQKTRKGLIERLRHAIAGELPGLVEDTSLIDVKAGTATFGVDGTDATTLVQAARTTASLASPERAQAA